MTAVSEPRNAAWRSLVGLLILATILRIMILPSRAEETDGDEFYYLQGGALVLEGLPSGMHYTFAGPEIWFAWAYTGGLAARYLVWPTQEERAVPLEIRPYVAVNHATFDVYHDISLLKISYIVFAGIVGLFGVAAAFGYGRRRGGLTGGVLLGIMAASLPVLVEHAGLAKPYSLGWSCVLIAAYFAATAETKPVRRTTSAIFLGLAVASRVELLGLLPVIVLLEIWPNRASLWRFAVEILRYGLTTAVCVIVAAPWSVTNLLGNLRAIATIRVAKTTLINPTITGTLTDLMWSNALGIAILIFFFAIGLAIWKRKDAGLARWPWLAALLALLLLSSCFRPTGYGLRHQGPAFMSLLLLLPASIGLIAKYHQRAAWVLVTLSLALCSFRAVIAIRDRHAMWIPDQATQWVETHVPPGTTVYLSPSIHDPLPTPESANAIWDELSSRQAAFRKFEAGIKRLQIAGATSDIMPPALSEQTVTTERSSARRFYVLGSRSAFIGPRFNIIRYRASAVFGVQDPVSEFKRTGGVLIWRSDQPDETSAPGLDQEPAIKWTNPAGRGTYVYVSPDIAGQLKK